MRMQPVPELDWPRDLFEVRRGGDGGQAAADFRGPNQRPPGGGVIVRWPFNRKSETAAGSLYRGSVQLSQNASAHVLNGLFSRNRGNAEPFA